MRTHETSPGARSLSTAGAGRVFRSHPITALLAFGFGSGLAPFAPGTAGSAVALVLAWLLSACIHPSHGPSIAAAVGLLVSGLAIGAIGVPISTRAARVLAASDPGCIVIDEFAGQFLASSPVPLFRFGSPTAVITAWIVSFLLFRLFDVWKPGPIRRIQDFPEGWGIVLDDLLAGLLAAGGTFAASSVLTGGAWR